MSDYVSDVDISDIATNELDEGSELDLDAISDSESGFGSDNDLREMTMEVKKVRKLKRRKAITLRVERAEKIANMLPKGMIVSKVFEARAPDFRPASVSTFISLEDIEFAYLT